MKGMDQLDFGVESMLIQWSAFAVWTTWDILISRWAGVVPFASAFGGGNECCSHLAGIICFPFCHRTRLYCFVGSVPLLISSLRCFPTS